MSDRLEMTRREFVSGLSAGGLVLAADGTPPVAGQPRSAPVVVGSAPLAAPRRGQEAFSATIAVARSSGISILVVPVFGIEERVDAMALLLGWRRMVAGSGGALIVERAADLEQARRDRKVALVGHGHGLQWLGRNLNLLADARAAGLRAVKLSPGWRNLAADGAFEATDLGLTRFGLELVRGVAGAGMVLDLAGAGRKSALQALERAGPLVMASHAGAAAVHPHPGNLDDDRIRAIARAGGVIGLTAFPAQIGDGAPDFDRWRRHLDHLLEIAGPEHVGLGLDQVDARPRRFPTDPWPDPPFRYPAGLATLGEVGGLGDRLRRAGLSGGIVTAVLGGNFERLLRTSLATPGAPRRNSS